MIKYTKFKSYLLHFNFKFSFDKIGTAETTEFITTGLARCYSAATTKHSQELYTSIFPYEVARYTEKYNPSCKAICSIWWNWV